MCGFVGIAKKNKNNSQLEIVKKMNEKISHRGPDDSSYYEDKDIALGFSRLSIIDLKERSNQPMRDEKSDSVITFNGEIYNYRELRDELIALGHEFNTKSDTEVLLKGYLEWKENVLQKVRGMFAFSIKQGNKLFIARDHFGIKPLYYGFRENGDFFFGSELKAFLAINDFKREVTDCLLFSYMELQHMANENTMLKGVTRLKNGSYLLLNLDDFSYEVKEYFRFQFKENDLTLDETVKNIQNAVKNSVEIHKRSDVKLGTFLSGGIDSSYITALTNPQLSFSIGFKEASGKYDESVHAMELSKILGIENRRRILDKEEVIESLRNIIYYLDEPQANLSSIPLYFLSELARREVTVVLSGEGADELFGGYQGYSDTPLMLKYKKIPSFIRKGLKGISHVLPKGNLKDRLYKGGLSEKEFFVGEAHISSENEVKALLKSPYNKGIRANKVTSKYFDSKDTIKGRQLVDLNVFMQKDILLKGDRMSMAHGLELRVPFLDKKVYEVASGLKDEYKIKGNITKYALRLAAKEVLPEEWYNREKKGFPVPMRYWLKDKKFYDEFKEVLSSKEASMFFEKSILLSMLDEHFEGRSLHQRQLYAAYVFLVWYERFIGR